MTKHHNTISKPKLFEGYLRSQQIGSAIKNIEEALDWYEHSPELASAFYRLFEEVIHLDVRRYLDCCEKQTLSDMVRDLLGTTFDTDFVEGGTEEDDRFVLTTKLPKGTDMGALVDKHVIDYGSCFVRDFNQANRVKPET